MLRGDLQVPRADFESGAGLTGIPDLSSESTFFPLPGDFPPIWEQEQKYFLGSLFLLTIPDWAHLENLTNFRKCIYRRECREAGSQRPHRSWSRVASGWKGWLWHLIAPSLWKRAAAQASVRVKSGAGSVFDGSKTRCFTKLNKYMSIFNLDSIYVQNCLSGSYSSHKNANRTNISIPEFQRNGAKRCFFWVWIFLLG